MGTRMTSRPAFNIIRSFAAALLAVTAGCGGAASTAPANGVPSPPPQHGACSQAEPGPFCGTVTSFPVKFTNPFGITVGSDGALWFTNATTTNAAGIVRFDAASGTTKDYRTLTSGSNPTAIVSGPDLALWFTETKANRIGTLTNENGAVVMKEYSIPTPSSEPRGITVGRDGALWFTEFRARKIGRITTAGAITEYPLSGRGSPVGITSGPDNALWFALQMGGIGRITTSGTQTYFTTKALPHGDIAVGPDDTLWFDIQSFNHVGSITTAGTVNIIDLPSDVTFSFSIRGGRGGIMLIGVLTRDRRRAIVAVTPSGHTWEYDIPGPFLYPQGLLQTADGTLWITNEDTSGRDSQILSLQ
jgi:virginiamycin B lyase